LRERAFARKELCALYLDQAFLAGNGNYLRSEILHDAGLDPRARPAELSRGEIGALARSTLTISRRSYETGGITLAPRLSASLKAQGLTRGRRRFYVFGREECPCYTCGGNIVRQEVGSRRIYYCRACQS
jgi:endonuclease-8